MDNSIQWETVNYMGASTGTTGGSKQTRVLLSIYGQKSEMHSVLAFTVEDAKMMLAGLKQAMSQIEDEDSNVPV
jgi:hypothetical protein